MDILKKKIKKAEMIIKQTVNKNYARGKRF